MCRRRRPWFPKSRFESQHARPARSKPAKLHNCGKTSRTGRRSCANCAPISDQVKVLQESTREASRAKVKLRRLATQADAASYIAEVEVAMDSWSSSIGSTSTVPLMTLARGILDSAAAPFARGDYGVAMDRAAQAEQLIAVGVDNQVRPKPRPSAPGEVLLQVAIPLKVTVDSRLRRQPSGGAHVEGRNTRGSCWSHRAPWRSRCRVLVLNELARSRTSPSKEPISRIPWSPRRDLSHQPA